MSPATTTIIRLLGQPKLKDHLTFVTDCVVGGSSTNKAQLIDDWRRANDHYSALEQREAELANNIEIRALAASLQPLEKALKRDPRYQFTFDKLPTHCAMVELDKLVVSQLHIDLEFSRSLQAQLNPHPEPDALFHFCSPPQPPAEQVKIRQTDSNSYIFSSDSNDFRPHQVALLQVDQIRGYKTFGPISGMVGMAVGFGSNFLTGICAEGRVVLHNGYHRAHAMRAAGITFAPCILQTATRLDELEVVAKSCVADDPDYYFGSARPPLLKDFFDENICRQYQAYKMIKKVEVNIDYHEYYERE